MLYAQNVSSVGYCGNASDLFKQDKSKKPFKVFFEFIWSKGQILQNSIWIWSNKGENLNTQSICASKYTAMVLFDILLAANKASL